MESNKEEQITTVSEENIYKLRLHSYCSVRCL